MSARKFYPLICVLLLALSTLVGCISLKVEPVPQEVTTLKGVPLYKQKPNQCGPVAMATVLNYWMKAGKLSTAPTPQELRAEIYSENAGGTLGIDFEIYARVNGLKSTRLIRGTFAIRRSIDNGVPVIVMVDYGALGARFDHFMVVVGYDSDGLVVHTGMERAYMDNVYFNSIWEKTGKWALTIEP